MKIYLDICAIQRPLDSYTQIRVALEAEAVAKRIRELVLREYAKPPKDRLTIGVVTMNLYQQDCIMDLLEKMRQDDRRFDLAMTAFVSEPVCESANGGAACYSREAGAHTPCARQPFFLSILRSSRRSPREF